MEYTELTCIPAEGAHSGELLVNALAEKGFESFVEADEALLAYIPSSKYSHALENQLRSEEMRGLLKSFTVNTIAEQNWNAVWESQYEPVTMDTRCRVRAPFHPADDTVLYDIVIEPKMSFGTAHHETTKLMITYLLDMDLKGKSLLDMGCGTGVLSILASLKEACPVLAIDNDEWAYRNSLENCELNAAGKIKVLMGDSSLLIERSFDVILANINRNILLEDIPVYAACLNQGGTLLLSGFFTHDLEAISSCADNHALACVSSRVENNWTAACFRKR